MATKGYSFRAKTTGGYTIKSLSEVLQNILTDVCFTFDKDGMSLLTVDNKAPPRLLVHLVIKADSFNEYFCPKPLNVGINLQQLNKLLKSIKKKDHLILFINKSTPTVLNISKIEADTGQPGNGNIKIQKLAQVATEIPSGYQHPIHISTNTYQKMCKNMQSIAPKIRVFAKGSFLRFDCQVDEVLGESIPFGEYNEDGDEDEYSDEFYTKDLSQLTKISGLDDSMQVFVPPSSKKNEIPLKFTIKSGKLGELNIYIKSIAQLSDE